MRRSHSNRGWILVLALCLGCAFVASLGTRAVASPQLGEVWGQGGWEAAGPPPPGAGDPDVPIASCGKAPRGAGVQGAPRVSTARVAGDDTAVGSVWIWRFRVVLQGLRLWSFVRL